MDANNNVLIPTAIGFFVLKPLMDLAEHTAYTITASMLKASPQRDRYRHPEPVDRTHAVLFRQNVVLERTNRELKDKVESLNFLLKIAVLSLLVLGLLVRWLWRSRRRALRKSHALRDAVHL
ncbi:MAG: hypothetical protein M1831_000032 [Alyxoria varia]|nr:MAG: hypothetical protein M1831_000032 [Alyxoria varia]